ncbi:hypothetical protein SKAU_G00060480, partial [Synaphobranchus kaupii]
MSNRTYNETWADAQGELNSLLTQELTEQVHPERDRVVFFQCLVTLYVRYVRIFRQLEEAFDQIVHPQKRRVIRAVLDGVMGRVLELKNEMVEKEFSDYHYMDDVIQDLKLTPALEVHPLSFEEAIKLIQVSERARQGRLRAKFMREIQQDGERQRRAKDRDLGSAAVNHAAVNIQKVWKGYQQRKKTKKEREEEMIFLGMALGSAHSQPCCSLLAAQANEACRRQRQNQHEVDFQKAIITITDQIREVEGPEMKETMKDQIRQWFIECHDATGSFPDYPEEEDGGSALIFSDKTPEQEEEPGLKM